MKLLKIFEKKLSFEQKNYCRPFFLVLSSVRNLEGQFVKVQKVFNFYCGSYEIFSVTLTKLLKTKVFEKKQSFQRKYYRVWQTPGNNFLGSTSYSDIYCGIYGSIFLGPERLLKTKYIEKKAIFPLKKIMRRFFLVVTNMTNVMQQFYNGPEGNSRSIVQATKWSFLRT